MGLETTMPSLFTRNEGTSKSVSNARDFFTKVIRSKIISSDKDTAHIKSERNILGKKTNSNRATKQNRDF